MDTIIGLSTPTDRYVHAKISWPRVEIFAGAWRMWVSEMGNEPFENKNDFTPLEMIHLFWIYFLLDNFLFLSAANFLPKTFFSKTFSSSSGLQKSSSFSSGWTGGAGFTSSTSLAWLRFWLLTYCERAFDKSPTASGWLLRPKLSWTVSAIIGISVSKKVIR